MTTLASPQTTSADKLAIKGGTPVSAQPLDGIAWPPVDEETAQELVRVYKSRKWSFAGPVEQKYQVDFAKAHDAEHCVFMANGTITLQGALHVNGIGPGDEVIVPALTWPATSMAALYVGATPVFVDIEADTFCLDPVKFEAAITPKTKAVIPVHIYGSMANIDAIIAIAKKHNILVIEDCAHAQGGKWNGKGVGSHGDVGSFSFQESKTMASGEGGACLTNSEEMAYRLYRFKHIGYAPNTSQGKAVGGPPADLTCHNFRATEFQAVILAGQLRNLDSLMATYNKNAATLEAMLAGVPNIKVQARGKKATRQSYYAWCVRFCPQNTTGLSMNEIFPALAAEGLGMGRTYGPVYKHLLWNAAPEKFRIQDGSCPVAENIVCPWTALMGHPMLGADEATIQKIGQALVKVAKNLDALRV